jgi:hypothetical protein
MLMPLGPGSFRALIARLVSADMLLRFHTTNSAGSWLDRAMTRLTRFFVPPPALVVVNRHPSTPQPSRNAHPMVAGCQRSTARRAP